MEAMASRASRVICPRPVSVSWTRLLANGFIVGWKRSNRRAVWPARELDRVGGVVPVEANTDGIRNLLPLRRETGERAGVRWRKLKPLSRFRTRGTTHSPLGRGEGNKLFASKEMSELALQWLPFPN